MAAQTQFITADMVLKEPIETQLAYSSWEDKKLSIVNERVNQQLLTYFKVEQRGTIIRCTALSDALFFYNGLTI